MPRKILYVEDCPIVGRFLVDALHVEGIEVTLVSDAPAAFASLEEDATSFDLVLCDNKLPGATGLELMASIRQRFPDLPLVLTTGFADDSVQGAAAAFDGLLLKPFEISELVAVLERRRR